MIDPAISWFEMKQISNKQAATVAQAVEQAWLTRYPWPKNITYNKRSEFMAEFATMIVDEYGIKKRGILPRNPQANAILERIHQVIGNMIKHSRSMTEKIWKNKTCGLEYYQPSCLV